MTRLFIENQELDITANFSHQITFAVDDLQNLDSKSTSFTKTIVLPATANNNNLLGQIFEFTNSNFSVDGQPNVGYNFNAAKSAKARIEIDGLQVMKGIMRLLQINIDGDFIEYEVALFGELGGLMSSFGSLKLTDLDLTEYNHTYDVTNIQNSWNNAGTGSGYYYPLIDYGNVSPMNDINFLKKNFYFTAFRPAFFVRDLLNRMLTDAGYTWESSFFDTSYFKSLIIPNNQSRLKFYRSSVFQSTLPQTISFSNAQVLTHSNIFTDLFTNVSSQVFTYTPVAAFDGTMNVNLRGTYTITNTNPSSTTYGYAFATMRIYKNNVLYYQDLTKQFGGYVTRLGLGTQPQYTLNLRYTGIPITFSQNDTWKIQLDMVTASGADLNVVLAGNTGVSISSNNPILVSAQYGDYLLASSTLPANIFQKDFFTSILKMFNLMVTEDKNRDKHLIITPNYQFYNTDRTTYLDYSDKVDRSQVIKIKPMSELNARYYTFKFKQDADYYNDEYRKKYAENYGDRIYDNEFEFSKETSSVEVIFSQSVLTGYSGNDKLFTSIMKKSNGNEEMVEHNIRIMFSKKLTGKLDWKIYAANNNVYASGITSYGYAGHVDNPDNIQYDLNFGSPKEVFFNATTSNLTNNIFNIFYSPYFAEITDKDSRLVTCKMKLNQTDIYNLDFGKFIWIDGVLYRLIKIKDYAEGEICEVELLRVIYTQY